MTTPLLWITGASTGIGAFLARHAAARGWRVAVSARSADTLAALAAEHGNIHAYVLDVTDRRATVAVLDRIESDHGTVDVAVLNAGIHADMPAAAFDATMAATVYALNLTGMTNGVGALLPRFLGRGKGHLALMASVAGYRGLPRAAAYCASKAGVIALAESLAAEIGHRGVKVQVICPGFVRTPLTDRNDFEMPFLMAPEDAARRIFDGLNGDGFEIAFPRRLAWPLKAMRFLPARLYFALIRKATGQ